MKVKRTMKLGGRIYSVGEAHADLRWVRERLIGGKLRFPTGWWLTRIYVPGDQRRHGIATAILNAILERPIILQPVPLGDTIPLQDLTKWYVKHGFVEDHDTGLFIKRS